MAITNGYATLAELKTRILDMFSYVATTISFTNATKTIADTQSGLRGLETNGVIEISGSASNDGFYTIASVADDGSNITVDEALSDEAAGDSVTILLSGNFFNDGILENVIEAASRKIDAHCHRRFYAASETRYYTPKISRMLFVDDLLSVTTLKTDDDGDRTYENTWAATDYDLLPLNAALDGEPYTMIEVTPNGSYAFVPSLTKSVEIAGSFGYASTTPDEVNEACLILGARLFKRKDAPFGVIGSPDLGELRNLRIDDPDVLSLLKGVKRVGA